MPKKYASGSKAVGVCGRSGKKMLLRDMVFDGQFPNMRVDPAWYEEKHPQEYIRRVDDPVALRKSAPPSSLIDEASLWALDQNPQSPTFGTLLDAGELNFVTNQDIVVEDTDAQVQVVGALCVSNPSYNDSDPLGFPFPFPSGIQQGDLLVFFVTRFASMGVDRPTLISSGWNQLCSFENYSSSLGTNHEVAFAWRIHDGVQTSVMVYGPNWTSIGGCVYAFRGHWAGANVIPQLYFTNRMNTADSGTTTNREVAISNALQRIHQNSIIFAVTSAGGSGVIDKPNLFNGRQVFDSETAVNIVRQNEGNNIACYARVFLPDSYNEFENLLPFSRRNFASWTGSVNVNILDSQTTGDIFYTRISQTGAVGRHEVFQDLTLTPGQRYTLQFLCAPTNFIYITVEDAGPSSERGWFFQCTTTAAEATVEIGSGTIPIELTQKKDGAVGAQINPAISFVPNTASVRIRLGISSTAGVFSETGLTSRRVDVIAACLSRGFRLLPLSTRLYTFGTPKTGLNGFGGRVVRGMGAYTGFANGEATYTMEIRGNGGPPIQTHLCSMTNWVSAQLAETDTQELQTDAGGYSSYNADWIANKAIVPASWGAPGRYYYEFQIQLWDSETSADDWRIGFTNWLRPPARIGNSTLSNIGFYPRQAGLYRGTSNSLESRVNNVAVNYPGQAPLVVGDILGFGVNYLTNEYSFYKNGVLIGTRGFGPVTITPLFAAAHLSTSPSTTRRGVFNFTGPFGGRKPAGFSAYDWENEVT